VLGQPLRLRLLHHLDRHGESSVQALADELEATQQNVSQHLGQLRHAGLVRRRQDGRIAWYSLANRNAIELIERARQTIADDLGGEHHEQ